MPWHAAFWLPHLTIHHALLSLHPAPPAADPRGGPPMLGCRRCARVWAAEAAAGLPHSSHTNQPNQHTHKPSENLTDTTPRTAGVGAAGVGAHPAGGARQPLGAEEQAVCLRGAVQQYMQNTRDGSTCGAAAQAEPQSVQPWRPSLPEMAWHGGQGRCAVAAWRAAWVVAPPAATCPCPSHTLTHTHAGGVQPVLACV